MGRDKKEDIGELFLLLSILMILVSLGGVMLPEKGEWVEIGTMGRVVLGVAGVVTMIKGLITLKGRNSKEDRKGD